MNLEERLANSAPFLDAAIDRHVAAGPGGRGRRPWSRTVSVAAAVVLVVTGLAGVAMLSRGGGGSPSSSPSTGVSLPGSPLPGSWDVTEVLPAPVGDALSEEQLAVVFSLLDVSTPEETVVFLSGNIGEDEVARCMTDAGFRYAEAPSAAERFASSPAYTMPAAEYAATYGLGITGWNLGLFPPGPFDPNTGHRRSLPAEQQEAYSSALGVCRGMTDPDRLAHSNALTIALERFREVVVADDRVVEAVGAWRDCMDAAGFHYDSPLAMSGSFYERMNSGVSGEELEQLHAEELRAAVANVPCEAAYTAMYRQVVRDRFDEYQQLYDTALASGAVPEAQG